MRTFATNPTLTDWVVAVTVMVGATVATLFVRQIVRILTRSLRFQDYVSRIISRSIATILLLIALFYALRILDVDVGPLVGALGVTGILLAMALQPVLGNLVGSVMLHARRPIRRGDQIHSNDVSGTVLDITGRAVQLMTFDGEVVYLPNLKVLDEALTNQTAEEYRRTVMPFQVGYDADLRHTRAVLERALAHVDALGDAPRADVLVTGFGESGVDMVARFWHPSEELTARWAISEVAITIRETLAQERITIPFPQRVLHLDQASTAAVDPETTDTVER